MAFKGVAVLDVGSSAITVVAGERGVNNTIAVNFFIVLFSFS